LKSGRKKLIPLKKDTGSRKKVRFEVEEAKDFGELGRSVLT
jgi:hypothetical protein